MRALAHRTKSPRNRHAYLRREEAAASLPAPRGAAVHVLPPASPVVPENEGAPGPTEPPAETDAWWLSRSQAPTFARRRIAISEACARALQAAGHAPEPIVVEFNGARFGGAVLSAHEGRYELDLGDALAQEMADVLDEDDGLDVELVPGRGQPTLAIHPYVGAVH